MACRLDIKLRHGQLSKTMDSVKDHGRKKTGKTLNSDSVAIVLPDCYSHFGCFYSNKCKLHVNSIMMGLAILHSYKTPSPQKAE